MDTLGKFPRAGFRNEVDCNWSQTARTFCDILTWAADEEDCREEGEDVRETSMVEENDLVSRMASEMVAAETVAATKLSMENSLTQEDLSMAMTTVARVLGRITARRDDEKEAALWVARQEAEKEAAAWMQMEISAKEEIRDSKGSASVIETIGSAEDVKACVGVTNEMVFVDVTSQSLQKALRVESTDQSCGPSMPPWPSFNALPRT
jgi:hypothetical protein